MKIRMELLSDTCPSSGEGQAGLVDLDVPFDKYGLPYIPAKRIKGCLREAALELRDVDPDFDTAVFERLFGKPGGEEGMLHLSNGYLENYEKIVEELDEMFKSSDWNYLNWRSVLEYYTTVRSQTSIHPETQTAKEDTLRSIRLIKAGNVFYFNVIMEPDEKCIELLKKCCKVLRRIGLNRTRGWGEVKCEFDDKSRPYMEAAVGRQEKGALVSDKGDLRQLNAAQDDGLYQMECTFTLRSQLMVTNSARRTTVSDNYISGSQILGVFAAEYIRQKGLSSDAHLDPMFQELFLSGRVKFLNAYLVDENGHRCLPLPLSIVRKKDDEELYDLAFDDDYHTVVGEGIQTEKRTGYCSPQELCSGNLKVFQVEREVEYHHQRPQDRTIGHAQEGNGIFFQMEVLSPGQTFKGLILGKKAHLLTLQELVKGRPVVRLGRSKTAQYAEAVVNLGDIKEYFGGERQKEKSCVISEGEKVIVTLTSPMILFDEETGVIRPEPQCFVKLLNKKWPGFVYERSFIRAIKVAGYNAKWGMSRPQVDALDAGSVIVMRYEGEETLDASVLERDSYGLRQNEGFGRIVLQMHGKKKVFAVKPGGKKDQPLTLCFTNSLLTFIQRKIITALIRNKALEVFREKFSQDSFEFGQSVVYKVIGMVEQADSHDGLLELIRKKIEKNRKEYRRFAELFEEYPSIFIEIQYDSRFRKLEKTLTDENEAVFNPSNKEEDFKYTTEEFYKTILQHLIWRIRTNAKSG